MSGCGYIVFVEDSDTTVPVPATHLPVTSGKLVTVRLAENSNFLNYHSWKFSNRQWSLLLRTSAFCFPCFRNEDVLT